MSKHTHTFILGKSGKVAVCSCGRFQFINLKPEDVIVEQPTYQVVTKKDILTRKVVPNFRYEDRSVYGGDTLLGEYEGDGTFVPSRELLTQPAYFQQGVHRFAVSFSRTAEQHAYVAPKFIDYISLRVASKAEKTFELVAVLTEEGEALYRTGSGQHELHTTSFETAKAAREFCKTYYKGITVQRD